MKVKYNTYDDNIVIRLETDEEKHNMWHLLNLEAGYVVDNSTSDADYEAIDKVSFSMFDSYNQAAGKYEKIPRQLNTINLEFVETKDGKGVYRCPLCSIGRGDCHLCNGAGLVNVSTISSKTKE